MGGDGGKIFCEQVSGFVILGQYFQGHMRSNEVKFAMQRHRTSKLVRYILESIIAAMNSKAALEGQ